MKISSSDGHTWSFSHLNRSFGSGCWHSLFQRWSFWWNMCCMSSWFDAD